MTRSGWFEHARCLVDIVQGDLGSQWKNACITCITSLLIDPNPVVLVTTIPRKEVIQPHLPVQLPCYDFTPITESTFDGSLPCGLGHRLRVSPTFVV